MIFFATYYPLGCLDKMEEKRFNAERLGTRTGAAPKDTLCTQI